jgi:putative acetyltransferase
MRLRPYAPGDEVAMAALYQRSVRVLGPADYTLAQVEAWAVAGPTAARFAERMADGRRAFMAEADGGTLVGFVDLEPDGHIDFLYAAPEAKGTGVADRLLDVVEVGAQADGIERLYSEASEAARRFFQRRGFDVLHRRDFAVGGVAIHNYAVEKRL